MDDRSPSRTVSVVSLPAPTLVGAGDDVGRALLDALDHAGLALRDGDVVAVASKVVALGEGAVVAPADVPSGEPDPRRALARGRARRVVADAPRALVVETEHGFVCANAGIDASNVAEGLLLLPADPDASAATLRTRLQQELGVEVAVVVTDTFGRPWRMGQVDVALGVAGMAPLRDERGAVDLHGRRLDVTLAAVADGVAAAADLVRTKSSQAPFVVLRGLEVAGTGTGRDLVRPLAEDLFPAGGPTMFDHAVTARPHDQQVTPVTELTAALTAAASAARSGRSDRSGTTVEVTDDPRPGILVTAASEFAAGMAVEAVRIALTGRGIATEVTLLPRWDEEAGHGSSNSPAGTPPTRVHVAVGPGDQSRDGGSATT